MARRARRPAATRCRHAREPRTAHHGAAATSGCALDRLAAGAGAWRGGDCCRRLRDRGGLSQPHSAARPPVGRAARREADRRGRQHLDQPDREGAAKACRCRRCRRARRSRSSSRTSSTARAASSPLRPQGVLARLRLRRRRQGRPRRHQQSRHRRRRRDHRQLQRRLQAQGREGARQGHQDRPGPPEGHAEEAACRPCRSARPAN